MDQVLRSRPRPSLNLVLVLLHDGSRNRTPIRSNYHLDLPHDLIHRQMSSVLVFLLSRIRAINIDASCAWTSDSSPR